jgi:hypothetical protein
MNEALARVKFREIISWSHTTVPGTWGPLYHYYMLGFADHAN